MDRNEVTDVRRPGGTGTNIRFCSVHFCFFLCETCEDGRHFLFDFAENSALLSADEGARHIQPA